MYVLHNNELQSNNIIVIINIYIYKRGTFREHRACHLGLPHHLINLEIIFRVLEIIKTKKIYLLGIYYN